MNSFVKSSNPRVRRFMDRRPAGRPKWKSQEECRGSALKVQQVSNYNGDIETQDYLVLVKSKLRER